MDVKYTHRLERLNGVELHIVEAGSGPATVLLHGFPDFWYGWRHQIPALVAAGRRVLVPDLRGYNKSEKPAGIGAYTLPRLTADIAELIERLAGSAVVVGHDWGGVIAWRLAALRPELVTKLVVLNAPHPDLFRRALVRSPQLLRSWYAGVFQLPSLPEQTLRAFDYALLRHGFARYMPTEDVTRHINALARDGALTAALHYYRAARREYLTRNRLTLPRVNAPTLVIWGERDGALDRRLVDELDRVAHDVHVERLDAGHFVQWEMSARVNELLTEFLS